MIKVRHREKLFGIICYGIWELDHASGYDGFFEFECSESEIEKTKIQVQISFDKGILTISDYDEIMLQLDEELNDLE